MKKILACLVCIVMMFALASCVNNQGGNNGGNNGGNSGGNNNGGDVTVMTYDEYAAAELEAKVVIEAYVQATQTWWFDSKVNHGKISVYAQDNDGAYFLYEMACSEEDAAKLTAGAKIRVVGYKAEWSGEIEITDCHFITLEADAWVAEATDVTALLGTTELINHQNKFVSFSGLTVKRVVYQNGAPGKDIYVTVTYNGADYDFCVESYLTAPGTDLYAAVGALNAGDVIDVEGFLYWYNGVNTHITKVTVK